MHLKSRSERHLKSGPVNPRPVDIVESIATEVLLECREDYVGLWSIVKRVQDTALERSRTTHVTLSIIRKLLQEGSVVAGQFGGNEFKLWNAPPEEIVATIASEWERLGRDPTLGEIVWLTARTVHCTLGQLDSLSRTSRF